MKKLSMSAVSLLCVLCLCMGIGNVGGAMTKAQSRQETGAEEVSVAQVWFYNQLDKQAAELYDAMAEWHAGGGFAKGKGDIDLVAGGHVTEAQLRDYMDGDPSLAQAFQNARDAFMHDHEELFYVDSTKLTMRVGQLNGEMAAFINSGENADYYGSGFTSESEVKAAIAETEAKLSEISTAMRTKLDEEFPKSAKANATALYPTDRVVTLAHDALVNALNYTYPSADAKHVAGIYAIVDGRANCEGYSRLFKRLMDEFKVPSVLVAGTAENSARVLEAHMWNYVQMSSVWYAVDVTWDDPMPAAKSTNVRDTYLLRGESDFNSDHFASGIFSPGGKEFSYPTLNMRNFGDIILETSSDDIDIYAEKGESGNETATLLNFSYKGKTVAQLEKEGIYVAGQFCYYGEEPQPWVPMSAYNLPDNGVYSMIPITKRGTIRFCVTDFDALRPDGKPDTHYKVDLAQEGNHTAIAEVFEIPYYSNYVPQPFIYTCEPTLTRKINAEKTAFTVIYDDVLKVEPGKTFTATVESSELDVEGIVEDVKMEATTINKPGFSKKPATKVTFNFTPSNSYQCYINRYNIRLSNVVGESSGKAPNPVPVSVGFDMSIPCPSLVSAGYVDNKAFVIALPTLVVNPNADIFEYEGSKDVKALDIRLVASIPSKDKQENFENLTGEADIKASSVYDLSLACDNYAARLKSDADYNLTVGIPYPKGYNYNSDPTVQFKAYHYKWVNGEYVAEEIVCRIGERGLEVVVDSFSPFLIAVVPKTNDAEVNKFVSVAVRTHGGDVMTQINDKDGNPVTVSTSGLYALKSGSKTFTIKPSDGYAIDKVLLNNKLQTISGNTVTFNYDTMAADNDLEVFFVAESVKAQDKDKGFVEVVNTLKREMSSISISKMPNKTDFKKGESFDSAGMLVHIVYNDNSVLALDPSEYTLSGTELKAGTNTITVTLKSNADFKATFNVSMEGDLPNGEEPTPKGNNPTVLIVSIVCAVLAAAALVFVVWNMKRKKSAK